MSARWVAGLRLEALVDGTTVVEGTTTAAPPSTRGIAIRPSYLRRGVVGVAATGLVTVRPPGERSVADEASAEPGRDVVMLSPREYHEIWIDGRLAHQAS